MKTQWRYDINGRGSLDYGPATAICQDIGWPVTQALELLQVVELAREETRRERAAA